MKMLLFYFAAIAVMVSCDKDRPEPEPDTDTHIVEYCVITNSLESGITIDIHNGGSVKIEPGEEMKIDIGEYTIPLGMADSRDRVVLHADMIVRGEVVHESVWWADVYWDIVREDGEDKYHYSRRYSLNVTDDLLEKIETTTVEAKTVETRASKNGQYSAWSSLGLFVSDAKPTGPYRLTEEESLGVDSLKVAPAPVEA